ncbi:MAG: DUF5716 family protein [Eubacteriales bacterium]|nr:DUF5716 family protein [Eubacteriales bacterium]
MEEKDGLVLGIELCENTSQVCFYNDKLNTPTAAASEDGKILIPNPIPLSECFSQDESADVLADMLAVLIECGRRSAGRTRIAGICICIEQFVTKNLEKIAAAMSRILYEKEDYEIICRAEAFAYYAYSQKKELYLTGTMLLDLGENGLCVCRLSSERKNGVDYIYETRREFNSPELIETGRGEKNLDDVSDELCNIILEMTSGIHVSSIYLTGRGFDTDKLPDNLVKAVCSRRKAFSGQNLYVKGACFCARESLNGTVFDNLILYCSERIRYGLEIDISERGHLKRFRIARAGMNWFEAERYMDFILEEERQLVFYLTDGEKVVAEKIIDISDIPFREKKLTRINVHVKYMAADRCVITVTDMGFGEFIKPSGNVFELEINDDFM